MHFLNLKLDSRHQLLYAVIAVIILAPINGALSANGFRSSTLIIGAIAGMLLLLVCLKYASTFPALVILVAVSPLDRLVLVSQSPGTFSGGNTIIPLIGFLVVAIWLLVNIIHFKSVRIHSTFFPLLLFSISVLLSVTYAFDQSISIQYSRTYFQLSIMVLLIIDVVDSPKKFRVIVWTVVLSNLFIAIYTMFSTRSSPVYVSGTLNVIVERPEGARGDPNFTAQQILTAVPFIWFMFLSETRSVKKLIFSIILTLLIVGTLSTLSVGGLIGLLSTYLLIVAFKSREKIPNLFKYLIIFPIISIMLLTFLPNYLLDKVQKQLDILSIFSQDKEARLDFGNNRGSTWTGALRTVGKYPVVGVGPGNAEFIIRQNAPRARSTTTRIAAHNMFLAIAVEFGILGLSAFLLVLAKALVPLRRILVTISSTQACPRWVALGRATMVGTLVFVIQGLALDSQRSKAYFIFIGLSIAYRLITARAQKQLFDDDDGTDILFAC